MVIYKRDEDIQIQSMSSFLVLLINIYLHILNLSSDISLCSVYRLKLFQMQNDAIAGRIIILVLHALMPTP